MSYLESGSLGAVSRAGKKPAPAASLACYPSPVLTVVMEKGFFCSLGPTLFA